MNHLHRDLAPISDAGWDVIDDEAKSRLPTYLAARKLVDFEGPHGWTHSATNLGRVAEIAGPVGGRERAAAHGAPPGGAADGVQGLADRARRRRPGHQQPGPGRARRGHPADRPGRERHRLPRPRRPPASAASPRARRTSPLPSGTSTTCPDAVARGVNALRQAGIGGPYGLAICPDMYTTIVESTEYGGELLLDHLRKILGGPLVWAPGIEGGVVLSLRGGDFKIESGQDLSIGYLDHDADVVRLYLEESLNFRVLEPDAAVALRLGD